jgi:ArsR family transcriptional regulator
MDMQSAAALYRLLADSTRLRLLRILTHDRFNVSELTAIVALAQSGVSRHLGLLKDAGLVREEREGGYVYYRLADDSAADDAAPLWSLLAAQFARSENDQAVRADDARMQELLRQRQENFDTHGDPHQIVPGRSWAAWARALGHLLPPLDVADIGCGDGHLTLEMARWAKQVTGIDRSDDRLERAKALATARRVTNVVWKKGDLLRLPLRDESIDLAVFSQSLRYATDPERALAEAVRAVRVRGRILVLDLKEHDQSWVRSRFGDQRLGFSAADLEALLQSAGLRHIRLSTGAGKKGHPFVVLIASASKPSDSRVAAAPAVEGSRRRW